MRQTVQGCFGLPGEGLSFLLRSQVSDCSRLSNARTATPRFRATVSPNRSGSINAGGMAAAIFGERGNPTRTWTNLYRSRVDGVGPVTGKPLMRMRDAFFIVVARARSL